MTFRTEIQVKELHFVCHYRREEGNLRWRRCLILSHDDTRIEKKKCQGSTFAVLLFCLSWRSREDLSDHMDVMQESQLKGRIRWTRDFIILWIERRQHRVVDCSWREICPAVKCERGDYRGGLVLQDISQVKEERIIRKRWLWCKDKGSGIMERLSRRKRRKRRRQTRQEENLMISDQEEEHHDEQSLHLRVKPEAFLSSDYHAFGPACLSSLVSFFMESKEIIACKGFLSFWTQKKLLLQLQDILECLSLISSLEFIHLPFLSLFSLSLLRDPLEKRVTTEL